MAYTGTTTAGIPSAIKAYYEKRFLMVSEYNLVMDQLGKPGRIPKGEGKTVVWNRMTNLATGSVLTEATDPTAVGYSATMVSAILNQYGTLTQVSDLVELTALDTTIEECLDRLAYQAALTIDTGIRDQIVSGGTVMYGTASYSNSAGFAPTRNSIDANDTLAVYDVRRAVKKLQTFAAQPHTRDRFVGVGHPNVLFDLQGDSNWTNAHIYTEKGIDAIYNGEVGEIYGTRWLMTQNAPVLTASGSASTDVYPTFIMGKEFFGVSKLQNLETYVDSPSKNSPLRLYSDIGWKASHVAKVLNDSFAVRLEVAGTA